jgi:hypothetical protein
MANGGRIDAQSTVYYSPSSQLVLNPNGTACPSGQDGRGVASGPGCGSGAYWDSTGGVMSVTVSPAITKWAASAPSTSGANVEVMAIQIGGGGAISGPVGTWVNLGSAQTWSLDDGGQTDNQNTAVVQYQFRDSTRHVVFGSTTVTFTALATGGV